MIISKEKNHKLLLLAVLVFFIAPCQALEKDPRQLKRSDQFQSAAYYAVQETLKEKERPDLTAEERIWLEAGHVVRVAVFDWPPYMFRSPSPSGISVDYLNAVASRIGFKVKYVENQPGWSASMWDLKGTYEHYDMTLLMNRTKEREKLFSFSEDYLSSPWVIYTREDSPFISGLESLKGKTLAAEAGYTLTDKVKKEYPEINILKVAKSEDALRSVAVGWADAYMGNLTTASFLIKKHHLNNLTVSAPSPFGEDKNAMAIRKDWPELASLINKGLAGMTPEEHSAITQKWGTVTFQTQIDYTLTLWILLITVLVILISMYWISRLSWEVRERIKAEKALRDNEERLELAKEFAETASRAKSEFLANMSHELRTPLNAVTGFSELLSSMVSDPKQKNYLNSIKTAGRSLLTLINDILDLSKIEAGRVEIQYSPVNIRTIINEIDQILKMRIQEKSLEYVAEFDQDLPESLLLDETRIRQILLNIVGNAVKFTEEGSIKLIVKVAQAHTSDNKIDLTISIEDTGIGIEPSQQEKIFDSFEQQSQQSINKYGGTGLGLTITKQLIELMGGRIELKSVQNEGSVFTIFLPAVEISSVEVSVIEEEPLDIDHIIFESSKVLIVDDIESNLTLLKELLTKINLNVIIAHDGQEAVLLAGEYMPDLILMDLRMPVMSGIDAAKHLKKSTKTRDIPIIALTASAVADDQEKSEEIGMVGYLTKPIRVSLLLHQLSRFLKHTIQVKPENETDQAKILFDQLELSQDCLKIMREEIIPKIEENSSGAMNIADIKEISNHLKKLGHEHNVDSLIQCSEKLYDFVNNFDIEEIKETLADLLKGIETFRS